MTSTTRGQAVARGITQNTARIDLGGLRAGTHTLRLVADGTKTRYRLSWTEDSLPLRRLEPAAAEILFRRVPKPAGGIVPP